MKPDVRRFLVAGGQAPNYTAAQSSGHSSSGKAHATEEIRALFEWQVLCEGGTYYIKLVDTDESHSSKCHVYLL